MHEFDVVSTETTELGRFRIRLDTVQKNGKEYPYSYIEAKDSVVILAETERGFSFVRQYRHPIKDYELEIPGGTLEDGENPIEAAKRELLEETGHVAGDIISLGDFYPEVGSATDKCNIYYTKCKGLKVQKLEPLERIEVVYLLPSDIESLIKSNEIKQSMAIVAWLKYKLLFCM